MLIVKMVYGGKTKDAARDAFASRDAGRSGFLRLDAAEDGFLEVSRSAEKLVLGRRHRKLMLKLLFDQTGCADQVGDLEKFVSDRLDALPTPFENISDGNRFSSLKAKNILRFSVIPSFRKTSADIIAYFPVDGKWANVKMKAGISPRQQRRLLRLPVTPVLPFVRRYYGIYFDLAQGGMAA